MEFSGKSESRFFQYVEPMIDSRGCWEWTGYRLPYGYGLFTIKERNKWKRRLAHRVSFSFFKHAIPEEIEVCHKCDNPSCVNPFHLFLGTRTDNARDSVLKNRHFNKRKTHCPKGHLYDGENPYIANSRICKTCKAEHGRRASAKFFRKAVDMGMCSSCKKMPPRESSKTCEICLSNRADRFRRRRERVNNANGNKEGRPFQT